MLAIAAVLAGAGTSAGAPAPTGPRGGAWELVTATVDGTQLPALLAAGVDPVAVRAASGGRTEVDAVVDPAARRAVAMAGIDVRARRPTQRADAAGTFVWRSAAALHAELRRLATAHPQRAEVVELGRTGAGTPILALRVTTNPSRVAAGTRPAVLYTGLQHAREWIAGEVVRRLARTVVTDGSVAMARVRDTTELWFVPVVNPDGYDLSFEPGWRLWRKNVRDNDGDGTTTAADGVDLNRNAPTGWALDDIGSSSDPARETYRGPAPASEAETQALDALLARLRPRVHLAFHSYGEVLLRPPGHRVADATPDEASYRALTGTTLRPAVEGYVPMPAAELYPANGDLIDHGHAVHGVLGVTIELAEGCGGCGFEFPDDEAAVAAEARRVLPFALGAARTAVTPGAPNAATGLAPAPLVVRPVAGAAAGDVPVDVDVRDGTGPVRLEVSVDGAARGSVPVDVVAPAGPAELPGARAERRRAIVRDVPQGAVLRVAAVAERRSTLRSEMVAISVLHPVPREMLVVDDGVGAARAGATAAAFTAAGAATSVVDARAGPGAAAPAGRPAVLDGPALLSRYRLVVWLADEPRPDELLALRDHLDVGGAAVLAGREPARELLRRGGTADDTVVFGLGVSGVRPLAPASVTGTGAYTGLSLRLADGAPAASLLRARDTHPPAGEPAIALRYAGGAAAAVTTGRTLVLGFDPADLADTAQARALAAAVLADLGAGEAR